MAVVAGDVHATFLSLAHEEKKQQFQRNDYLREFMKFGCSSDFHAFLWENAQF